MKLKQENSCHNNIPLPGVKRLSSRCCYSHNVSKSIAIPWWLQSSSPTRKRPKHNLCLASLQYHYRFIHCSCMTVRVCSSLSTEWGMSSFIHLIYMRVRLITSLCSITCSLRWSFLSSSEDHKSACYWSTTVSRQQHTTMHQWKNIVLLFWKRGYHWVATHFIFRHNWLS